MTTGDPTATMARAVPSATAECALAATARGATAAGALLVALGGLSLVVTVLLHGLSVEAVLGGGGLVVGGGLWVVAQGCVARWVDHRRPRALLAALMHGAVAVLATCVGWGTLVGLSWAPVGVTAVVGLVEWILVRRVDPAWTSRGRGVDVVEALPEMEEALVLRWLALASMSLGVGAGVAATLQFCHYVLNLEEGWNLLGAYASVYFFAVVGAWCAPQLALLAWAGGDVRSGVPVIVLGAGAWAALIWAVSGVDGLEALIPLLVGAVLVLEVVVVCMILWRRLS